MRRRQRKSGKQNDTGTNHINLLTAIANLIVALILLYEKLKS